jgi:hypothetical protein
LDFKPTHPKAAKALAWMGFEARSTILELLDAAVADHTATVRVVCYELNDPEILSRLKRLKKRLWIIIDNSKDHKADTAAETILTGRLFSFLDYFPVHDLPQLVRHRPSGLRNLQSRLHRIPDRVGQETGMGFKMVSR